MTQDAKPTGLTLMREPFPVNQISKLPKPTKKQTDDVKADFKLGMRCQLCGQWHHKDVVHLDYVGHAALTDRLLECDPDWNWEPVAFNTAGTPLVDGNGGMWIKLTVCGVTRLGYGHADGKQGGDAIKEVIGDALRNAAMRFGAALDLWHKGDLHGDDEPATQPGQMVDTKAESFISAEQNDQIIAKAFHADVSLDKISAYVGAGSVPEILAKDFAAVMKKLDVTIAANKAKKSADLGGDTIPY